MAVRPTAALTFELGAVYNHSRVDDLSPQILPVFAAAPARLGRIPNVASHAVRGSVNYATMVGDEDFRVNGWANYIGPSRLGIGPRSEEHTSELQSLMRISYAVFCLKKKQKYYHIRTH